MFSYRMLGLISYLIFAGEGLVVLASAKHTEGCGFDSRTGKFHDFFCSGVSCAGIGLCCLNLFVTLCVIKLIPFM